MSRLDWSAWTNKSTSHCPAVQRSRPPLPSTHPPHPSPRNPRQDDSPRPRSLAIGHPIEHDEHNRNVVGALCRAQYRLDQPVARLSVCRVRVGCVRVLCVQDAAGPVRAGCVQRCVQGAGRVRAGCGGGGGSCRAAGLQGCTSCGEPRRCSPSTTIRQALESESSK
jgi:hypothetical protein